MSTLQFSTSTISSMSPSPSLTCQWLFSSSTCCRSASIDFLNFSLRPQVRILFPAAKFSVLYSDFICSCVHFFVPTAIFHATIPSFLAVGTSIPSVYVRPPPCEFDRTIAKLLVRTVLFLIFLPHSGLMFGFKKGFPNIWVSWFIYCVCAWPYPSTSPSVNHSFLLVFSSSCDTTATSVVDDVGVAQYVFVVLEMPIVGGNKSARHLPHLGSRSVYL